MHTSHPSAEDLLDYFEAKLPDEPERRIEEHLARCADCTATAREVHSFHEVWSRWTAAEHGEAYLRGRLAEALGDAAARAANPAWRERLQQWRTRWAGAAEAGVRVVLQASAQASRVVAESIDALARPGSLWHFAPEPLAVPIRGAAVEAHSSAVLTTALSAGTPRARVALQGGDAGEIVVRLDNVPPGEKLPLVLLVGSSGTPTRVAEVERQPGTGYLIARFDDVRPGEYLVAFEPLETAERG